MRLLQFFFSTLWVTGYVGNGLLFLYTEWLYLRRSWIQIFNPLLHLQVLSTLLSTSVFWLFLTMAILGYLLMIALEKQIGRNKNNIKLDRTSSSLISPPLKTNVQPQVLQSLPRQVEQTNRIRTVAPNEIPHSASLPLGRNNTESLDTASRVPERAYCQYSTDELEGIVNSNWNTLNILQDIHHELGFRSRRRAYRLRERISRRLEQLKMTQFVWPTTAANTGSQNLPRDAFRYEEGLLRHYGYKVGIHGLAQSERLEILNSIFLQPLMPMDNREYLNEWGAPRTARRLQKLAESIAAFTRNARRRNDANFSQAIQDWETDLAYLKRTYYDNRFSFRWPRT